MGRAGCIIQPSFAAPMDSTRNEFDHPYQPSSALAGDDDVARLRIPPHSNEAEQSMLGGLLLDNSTWDKAADLVTASDFYRYEHRVIFQALGDLVQANKPADVITVHERLQSLGKAQECGGLAYLNALAQSVPSAANLRRYAEIVRERAVLRKLIEASDEIATRAFNPKGRQVSTILDESESLIFKIGEEGARSRQGFQELNPLLAKLVSRVSELAENGAEEVTGVRTGFYDFDRMTAGLQPGDLVVLAARPSMGKAQPLDARVRTRTGWKRMDELAVGDALASVDGQPSMVTGVFPQGQRTTYELTFSDGRRAEACDEHLWRVHGRSWKQPRVVSTAALRALLARRRNPYRLWIDMPTGDFGHERPLPIDPWVLGCLLGSPGSEDQRVALQSCGRVEGAQVLHPNAWRVALDAMGLSGCSGDRAFIPMLYLEARRAVRLDVLRGLLDADGQVARRGGVRLATRSAQLARDVAELVRSLGGWCSVRASQARSRHSSGKPVDGLPVFVCHIDHPEPASLFLMSEKATRCADGHARRKRPVLLSIQAKRITECQCISVSHPSRLYITDDHVVTHNTALAINIAEHVAVAEGLPVAVFSMEMGAAQLALRMVGSIGRIDQQHLRTGALSNDEWSRMTEAVDKLSKTSIFIDETPALNQSELRARARRLARHCGKLGLIVVDYLQLMSGSAGSEENRATELGEISRSLKALAKELQCPVIALSQLNRSVETRNDKRPLMSDLRESGAIEQDADVIMFIYRDDYYNKDNSKEPGVAEVIIAKQRNGPVGTVKMAFIKAHTKFDNLAPGSTGGNAY